MKYKATKNNENSSKYKNVGRILDWIGLNYVLADLAVGLE